MAGNQRRKSNKMDCSHRDEDTDDDDVESHQTDSEGQEEDDSEKSSGELEDEEEDNVTNTKLTSSKSTSNDRKKTITIPNDGSTKPSINNPTLQLFANFIQSIPEETKIQLLASSTNKSSLKSQPSIKNLTRQPKLNSTSSKVGKKRKAIRHDSDHEDDKDDTEDDEDDKDLDSCLSLDSDLSSLSAYSMGEQTMKSIRKPKYKKQKKLDARVALSIQNHLKTQKKLKEYKKKISKTYDRKLAAIEKKYKMVSKKPSTPPIVAPTFSNDEMQKFVSTFLKTTNQGKNLLISNDISSDIPTSEQKSTRGNPNPSKTFPIVDPPNFQKPTPPDFDNYRDNNQSPYTESSRTPSPPYNSNSYGDPQPYEKWGNNNRERSNEYGIKKPYARGLLNQYTPPQPSIRNNWNYKTNNDPVKFWGLVDCGNYCGRGFKNHNRKYNRQYIKSRLREAIGPDFSHDKDGNKHFNWSKHHGICYYAMSLIQEYAQPLGKRQIEKYLTAVCPTFESFVEANGFARTLLLSQIKVHLKRAYYKIPYERICYPKPNGNFPQWYYDTKRVPPTPEQLIEEYSTSSAIDDLTGLINRFRGTYVNEQRKDVPIGVPQYNFPTYISIDTNQQNIESFGENEGFSNIPTCSSTSRKSTLDVAGRQRKAQQNLDYLGIKSNIVWKDQFKEIKHGILEDMYVSEMPTAFSKVDFDDYMNEGIMDRELFESLAKYPRFSKEHYIKVYVKTLWEYMNEIHILYDPKKK